MTQSLIPAGGVIFGDYELLERSGRGGMGVVYRARHTGLQRTVALKMLKGGRLAEPAERRRFTIEAEAVARLDHPHIVPVYEVGECEDQPYYTMRLVEGGRSGTDLRGAEARTAAGTLALVARAVHFAHQPRHPAPRSQAREYPAGRGRRAVRGRFRSGEISGG